MKTARFFLPLVLIAWEMAGSAARADPQRTPTTIFTTAPEKILVTAQTLEQAKGRLLKDGAARSGFALRADPADKPGSGVVWFTYTYRQNLGRVRGTFRLKVVDNTSPKVVAKIQGVINATDLKGKDAQPVILSLRGTDFRAPGRYQDFSIEVVKGEQGFGDWGVYTEGVTTLWFDGLLVKQVSTFTPAELLARLKIPVKPAQLRPATQGVRVHETHGLFMEQWRVKQAVRDLAVTRFPGATWSQSYLKVHPQNTGLSGFPQTWQALYQQTAVVLNNVPAKALTLANSIKLKQYVTDGGCVVMMGDTHGLGSGLWQENPFVLLLPITLEKKTDLVFLPLRLETPRSPFPGVSWKAKPYTVYHHRATLRPDAEVLLASGKVPLIVERRVGKGRVIVLLLSVCGEKMAQIEGIPFWDWEGWTVLLGHLLTRVGTRAQR